MPTWAHGTSGTVEKITTVRGTSQYDTGEPMAQGQVAVYSPDNIETPWLTGTTDNAGVFEFIPDGSAGDWEVVVRKAGHGQSFTVSTEATAAEAPSGLSALQKGVTAVAIVWGFVGTALFFSRAPVSAMPATVSPSPSKES